MKLGDKICKYKGKFENGVFEGVGTINCFRPDKTYKEPEKKADEK